MALDAYGNFTPDSESQSYSGLDAEGNFNTNTAPPPAPVQPTGPAPDAWPGWKWDSKSGQWVIPPARQAEYDQWVAGQALTAHTADVTAGAPTFDQAVAATGADQNIADRRFGQQGNTVGGQPLPSIEQQRITDARASRDAALVDQRKVLEKALNLGVDPVEQQAFQQRAMERATLGANTVASNARGGAGAVAAARRMVNQQMPALAGQAAEQGRADELQAFNARVQAATTAGGIANTIGQTATQAFGQEGQLATDTARIGLETIDRINNETGMKIQADEFQQNQLGQMFSDMSHVGLAYDQLDVGVQEKIFDQIAESHHIDQQVAGQLKAIAAQKKKGVMDYVMGFLGAGEQALGTAGKLGWQPLKTG